jgi:hypothetical protein
MVAPKKAHLDHVSTTVHLYFFHRRLFVLTRPVCWFWSIVSASPGMLASQTTVVTPPFPFHHRWELMASHNCSASIALSLVCRFAILGS